VLLVPADAVPLDQSDEVLRRETGQGRAAEVGIAREELCGAGLEVGEVAAAAARDADFFGDPIGVVDQQYACAALTGPGRAEQPGGAGADDDGIESRRRAQEKGASDGSSR
jgi:hypothetical protein